MVPYPYIHDTGQVCYMWGGSKRTAIKTSTIINVYTNVE
jgi:hypothetical protein